jgi:hypothetical protein
MKGTLWRCCVLVLPVHGPANRSQSAERPFNLILPVCRPAKSNGTFDSAMGEGWRIFRDVKWYM